MTNCTEEIGTSKIEFGHLGRRVVEGRFDGGSMTGDGGVMLLVRIPVNVTTDSGNVTGIPANVTDDSDPS
ncbi:MAG: hypothetical protein B7Z52_04390 [Burkholderiales bacterium 12-64-5]|nr:MAG: hypothetical protein B7Z52_04390 [Burkholderiales bacterium 12-64-5]